MSKITFDSGQVSSASTEALTIIVKDSLTVIGLTAYLVWLEPLMSLLLVLPVPVIGITLKLLGRRLLLLNTTNQKSMAALNSNLNSAIYGQKIVKNFKTEEM